LIVGEEGGIVVVWGFLKEVSRRAKAISIADSIAPLLLASSRLGFVLPDQRGRISEALRSDELVLSLFYGAIARCIEEYGLKDVGTVGHAMWVTFDRLFPGHGRTILDLCNKRLEEKDKAFKEGVRSGMEEMDVVINAGGKCTLISIHLKIDQLERHFSQGGAGS
jgi:hypothetical protein